MWGIFVGIGVGILEIFLLKKAIAIVLDANNSRSTAALIIIAKFAIILVTLFLMAKLFDVQTMLFCAGGLIAVIIIIPVVKSIKTINMYKKNVKNEVD